MNDSVNLGSNPSRISFEPSGYTEQAADLQKDTEVVLREALTIEIENVRTGASNTLGIKSGAVSLDAPAISMNAADITLRIALLQEVLNELTQKVSKSQIEGRMEQANSQNKLQLEKMKDQLEKVEEAQTKQKEADKKANIFEAVVNWVNAAVSFASAVFTAISAVGYIFTNPVAAVGLFVAAGALVAAGVCQTVLAIDATMRAAGKEGFLSDQQKANFTKAAEICGYVALGASVLSGIAVILKGVAMAVSAATQAVGKMAFKEAFVTVRQGVKEATKDLAKKGAEKAKTALPDLVESGADDLSNSAIRAGETGLPELADTGKEGVSAARNAFYTAMKPWSEGIGSIKTSVSLGVAKGAAEGVKGGGQILHAKLMDEKADIQKEADDAEAALAALKGAIAAIRKIIEDLESQLAEIMDQASQTMSIIFGAIDDCSNSMTQLFHIQSA